MKKLVFIIEEDCERRAHFSALVEQHGYSASAFSSAQSFLQYQLPCEISCVLVSLSDRSSDAAKLMYQLDVRGETLPVIYLAQSPTIEEAVAVMRAGAWDYLAPPFVDGRICTALENAMAVAAARFALRTDTTMSTRRLDLLTQREREVLTLVLSGYQTKQICAELGIQEITVKVHKRRIMDKMHARTLVDLVRSNERVSIHRTIRAPEPSVEKKTEAALPNRKIKTVTAIAADSLTLPIGEP